MSTIKTKFVQAIRIFGIMALVAAFAASAFPARGYAADANPGKITVQVYAIPQGSPSPVYRPVAGAVIEILDGSGTAIAKTMTNAQGVAIMELEMGEYKVRVTAPNYSTASNSVTVKAGQNTTLRFNLRSTSSTPTDK